MTVQEYLQELDENISAAPEVVDVDVIRRSIWDTGMEVIGLYRIIRRWDNAPHHQQVQTFPHYLHDGSETNVVSHDAIAGLEVLEFVISQLACQP